LLAARGGQLRHEQQRALHAIQVCRTPACGSRVMDCSACSQRQLLPQAWGHRSCPACQHHTTSQWLDRQMQKLLPVDYFMVTFTLPAGLRGVASCHPKTVYAALFDAASAPLKQFGHNPRQAIDLGLCAVLHTHARNLTYHPHVHVVVPGGGVNKKRRQWRKLKGRYRFNTRNLAKVFRAKLLDALNQAGLRLPTGLPDRWIVDGRNVGSGAPALLYLSRSLYRGVVSEHNRVAIDRQQRTVTFRYVESGSGQPQLKTLSLADFLWRVVRHILPRGFRRVREYGFVHPNAKRTLRWVQLLFRVMIQPTAERTRPPLKCRHCQAPMHCVAVIPKRLVPT
jgi:hypothetical protein